MGPHLERFCKDNNIDTYWMSMRNPYSDISENMKHVIFDNQKMIQIKHQRDIIINKTKY